VRRARGQGRVRAGLGRHRRPGILRGSDGRDGAGHRGRGSVRGDPYAPGWQSGPAAARIGGTHNERGPGGRAGVLMSTPVIRTEALTKEYQLGSETVRALRGVDLTIE